MDFIDRMRTRAEHRRRGTYLAERIGKSLCFATALDTAVNLTGAAITEGQAKTWFTAMRAALAEMGDPIAHFGLPQNLSLLCTVGANALTIAVRDRAGAVPSANSPVTIPFRNVTVATGDFLVRNVTAALTVVVSSGSTLGHASARNQHIWVYAIDNAGTVELAVSNLPPDYPGVFGSARRVTTTAEGGAGAADSATGVYSATARTNVPWVCIGKLIVNQTTAGTWAAVPTQVDVAPFDIPRAPFFVHRNGVNQTAIAAGVRTKVQLTTEDFDPDAAFDSATNFRYQPNVAGFYQINAAVSFTSTVDGQLLGCVLRKNGVDHIEAYDNATTGVNNGYPKATATVQLNGTTDFIEVFCHTSILEDLWGLATVTYANGSRI